MHPNKLPTPRAPRAEAAPVPTPALSLEIDMPGVPHAPEREDGGLQHHHFTHCVDAAREALLTRLGCGDAQMQACGYAWPIVEMRLKYLAPFTVGQPVRVRATIVEWEHRLAIAYLVSCASSGRRLHKAMSIQVALDIATGRMCWVCPPVLRDKLGIAAPDAGR